MARRRGKCTELRIVPTPRDDFRIRDVVEALPMLSLLFSLSSLLPRTDNESSLRKHDGVALDFVTPMKNLLAFRSQHSMGIGELTSVEGL